MSNIQPITPPIHTYSVCIRTLGTAGEAFEREVQSLLVQTLKPEKILAYIPHGYDLPKPFEGMERVEFVRCDKGMITQRSLLFEEVETPLILFLDDDVELASDSAETLIRELTENQADCVAANTFPNHAMTLKKKIRTAISSLTFPSLKSKWAVRIRKSAHYSYANNPLPVMPSQSAAGPCALMKTDVYHKLDFADERWLEQFGYALGDDLLMFNKLHQRGYRLMMSYDNGAVHLDAMTGHSGDREEKAYKNMVIWYLLWHRTQYSTARNRLQRLDCSLHYYATFAYGVAKDILFAVRHLTSTPLSRRFQALKAAKKIVIAAQYRELGRFA